MLIEIESNKHILNMLIVKVVINNQTIKAKSNKLQHTV